jgi:hypothetical protein
MHRARLASAFLDQDTSIDQEEWMPFITIDVVPATDEEMPFKVVFKQGANVIAEWPVESKEAGEEEVLEVIKDLADQ